MYRVCSPYDSTSAGVVTHRVFPPWNAAEFMVVYVHTKCCPPYNSAEYMSSGSPLPGVVLKTSAAVHVPAEHPCVHSCNGAPRYSSDDETSRSRLSLLTIDLIYLSRSVLISNPFFSPVSLCRRLSRSTAGLVVARALWRRPSRSR